MHHNGSREEAKHSATISLSNDSDDDSDIQWEEGDDLEDHAEAVERTLATMMVTGGLTEGSIEINFDATAERNETQDNLTPEKTHAHEGLEKVMRILVGKGMPVVSRWIQALTLADSLTSSAQSKNALVQITKAQRVHRKNSLERMMELKQRMAQIVLSAQRLGMESMQQTEKAPAIQEHMLQTGKRLSKNNANLQEKLSRRNVARKHHRSNKIQIKYRSDL